MASLLLTADWHLDRAAWARHPEATGDSVYALQQIVKLASACGCPVVAAGDVFDTADPDSATVHAAVDSLNELEVPVYFVQGQHERASPPWLALANRAVHLHARRVQVGDLTLVGWDYCADLAEAREYLLGGPCDLLVTHQVFAEAMATQVRSTGKVADLPSTVNRVVSGDYHEHRVTSHSRYQLPPVELISPGSTHYRAVNEPGPKAVYLLSPAGLKSIPLDTRPVRQFTVRTDNDLAGLAGSSDLDLFGPCPSERPPDLNRPVIRVRAGRAVDNAADRLRDRFPRAHLHVAPLTEKEGEELKAGQSPAIRPGAAGVLELCLSRLPLAAQVAADARVLLTAADPTDAVTELYTRITQEASQ